MVPITIGYLGVFRVSILGIAIVVLGRYPLYIHVYIYIYIAGYLDPEVLAAWTQQV